MPQPSQLAAPPTYPASCRHALREQFLERITRELFLKTELAESLPDHVAERIDESEWTAMKLRVGEYVEALLTDATENAT